MDQRFLTACIATTVLLVPGCLDATADPPEPLFAPPSDVIEQDEPAVVDVSTAYSIAIAELRLGDMQAVAYVDVPRNATSATIRATWTGGIGIGDDQHCMLHDGTGKKAGAMLDAAEGPQPLAVGPVNLTDAIDAIGVMCWAGGAASVAIQRVTAIEATFARREGEPT